MSTPMITVLKKPVNRYERRLAEKESNMVVNWMLQVEEQFYKALFDERLKNTYDEIYAYFLDGFNKGITHLNEQYNFKIIRVNEHYFERTFKSYLKQ